MRNFLKYAGVFLLLGAGFAGAQTTVLAVQHAAPNVVLQRVLHEWPEGRIANAKDPGAWDYQEGVLLRGMIAEWRVTGDKELFAYVKAAVDRSVDSKGVIHMEGGKAFPVDAHSLDNIEMGRSVVTMYRVLMLPKYYIAAKFLYDQMQAQPKNASGGYWHKEMYPNQMWLDGAYMAGPFLASYGRTFHDPAAIDSAATQLLLMHNTMRDPKTGLLRHGWDESKKMGWADAKTGLSAEVWGRGMGWYAMALVDVLEQMPETDPQRAALLSVTQDVLGKVVKYQDPATGVWWQVMDKGHAKSNYLEASASCMFVYALAKAVRLNYVPLSYESNVTRGWAGIQKHFVKADGTLTGTVTVAGLGGTPYRSGTYDYYAKDATGKNDAKGVGAYLLALSEMTQRTRAGELLQKARGKTVLVDGWYNSDMQKSADGTMESFHYKWVDDTNNGYSLLGRMFRQYGMYTEQLNREPLARDLKDVAVYVIASPDIASQDPMENYMDNEAAETIADWVKRGGVLVIMENDSEHADQTHIDLLSDRFGIHFNPVTRNRELNMSYANTMVAIPAGAGGIFHESHRALMKGTCSIAVTQPAQSVVTDKGDAMIAVSHLGKGAVFTAVDPWVYNEYTDGRKAPLEEDNFAAAQELVHWLVGEAVKK